MRCVYHRLAAMLGGVTSPNAQMIEYWNANGAERWVAARERIDRGLAAITHELLAFAAPRPGERVLDVGCGWGSFALHAASRHGARVTGITLSPSQAERARERAAEAGLSDRIEILLQDYRELDGEPFDAISSIGMVEHVGEAQIDVYAQQLARLLKPGGRLLNHGIARLRHTDPEAGPFSERYVFPDAEPLHLSRILLALERAGFVTQHVEGFGQDYAETLRHWAQRLDDNLARATELAGEERIRVWRLYLRAARNGFLTGFTGIYQVRAALPGGPAPEQAPGAAALPR